MNTTTQIGTWSNFGTGGGYATLEDAVGGYLDEWAADYDLDGLVEAYRAAINERLPEGVVMAGDQFYADVDAALDEVLDEYGEDAHPVAVAVESVDLGVLAEQFSRAA